MAYGAHIAMVDGSFDDALEIVQELCDKHSIELVNSINPNRIEGQKTAAFEILTTWVTHQMLYSFLSVTLEISQLIGRGSKSSLT